VRVIADVPHVVHVLLSIVSCGFWLPVWALDVMLNWFRVTPYRCNVCGQKLGVETPEQKAERARRLGEEARRLLEVAKPRLDRTESEARGTFLPGDPGKIGRALEAFRGQIHDFFKDIDDLLKDMAGEGNDLIHVFLRIVGVALVLASVMVYICLIWSSRG